VGGISGEEEPGGGGVGLPPAPAPHPSCCGKGISNGGGLSSPDAPYGECILGEVDWGLMIPICGSKVGRGASPINAPPEKLWNTILLLVSFSSPDSSSSSSKTAPAPFEVSAIAPRFCSNGPGEEDGGGLTTTSCSSSFEIKDP